MTSVLCEGVIVKRSGLVEGVSKLRMTVPTTESIGNDVGVTGNMKCLHLKIVKGGVEP